MHDRAGEEGSERPPASNLNVGYVHPLHAVSWNLQRGCRQTVDGSKQRAPPSASDRLTPTRATGRRLLLPNAHRRC